MTIAKTAIEQIPVALEEASWTLGRGRIATWGLVTLPLAGRELFSAILTCWARALGEFGTTILFAGSFPRRTQTIPTALYRVMQYNIEGAIGLALLMLCLSTLAFVLAQPQMGRLRALGSVR